MARRLSSALILACAALAVPSAAQAATDLDIGSATSAPEPKTGKEALQLAKQITAGQGAATGRELTPVLKVLAEKLPELKGADRRRAERYFARPTGREGDPSEATYSVPEAAPVCGPHFCIHYVTSTSDAPPGGLGYVNAMLNEFENVYNVENGQLQWKEPVPDQGRGGDDKTDVYIRNVGGESLYGYAAPDCPPIPGTNPPRCGQPGKQWFAYLVMDNDYAEKAFTDKYGNNFIAPVRVTAAHEYNHVLQFGIDSNQDSWMFEATATWMEDKVYDEINDYRGYLDEWARRTTQPLTTFFRDPSQNNSKVYGDAVFNRWIDERYGADTIRRAWDVSIDTGDFAPAAYDRALREKGTTFDDVFNKFAADTAEWKAANSAFEEGESFPDVARQLDGGSIQPQSVTGNRNGFVSGSLDHTAYALVNVDPAGESNLTLGGTLPRRVAGAIALVGRTGEETTGSQVVALKRLPRGGAGKVTLPNATSFSRVTAVIVNSDITIPADQNVAFNNDIGDWRWLADESEISLAVNDFTKPTVRKASPKSGARRVSRTPRIKVTFSERIAGANRLTVKLVAPNGRSVPSDVVPSGRTLKITPARRLKPSSRYTVRISSAVTDGGGNALPTSKRNIRFTTGR